MRIAPGNMRDAGISKKRGTHMGLKCIGIDIGGTSVKLGIFEEDGTLVKKWEIPTRKEENGKYILGDIAASIRKTTEENGWKLSDFPARAWDSRDRFFRTDTVKCV